MRLAVRLLGDDDFAAVVVTAVRADPMRRARLAALRARHERGQAECVVRAAKVAPAL